MKDTSLMDFSAKTILLVEDNEFNQQVVLGFLEDTNVQVDVANNGLIALEKLASKQYDLILMDIQMPEMDGLTATKEIRKQAQFKEMPIIAMTAHAMPEELNKCLEVGMNEYFTKPIDPNALFNLMEKYLSDTVSLTENEEDSLDVSEFLFAHQEKTLMERIAELTCLDSEKALLVMGGRQHIYEKFVIDFYKVTRELHQEIDQHYQENDFETLYRIVHSLKSNAAYIGAYHLADLSAEVEEKIKAQPRSCLPLLEQLIKEHQLILSAVATLIDNDSNVLTSEQAIVPINNEILTILLNSMIGLLEQEDAEAEDLLPQLIDYTQGSEFSALAERISELVEDIEYVSAIKCIVQLKSKLVA